MKWAVWAVAQGAARSPPPGDPRRAGPMAGRWLGVMGSWTAAGLVVAGEVRGGGLSVEVCCMCIGGRWKMVWNDQVQV
jgi:hypothetical protein